MLQARFINYQLDFKFAAGTSRGVLLHKPSSFLLLEENGATGIGECSTIPDLSIDPMHLYNSKLEEICQHINEGEGIEKIDLRDFPSIAFGLETALLDLHAQGSKILFKTDFSQGSLGIPINGLVWMGNKDFMQKQVREKIEAGYHCIKLKIGALDFDTELDIIRNIRQQFSSSDIEIRLDANGGFKPEDALTKLEKLAEFEIHSIEQPIKPKQWEAMSILCQQSAIPIVLDEELIGISPNKEMLNAINPAYIILKPSLIGGIAISEEWIHLAGKKHIDWWVTSALESNIGLNAIAQWTATLGSDLPQGLGTGQLYHNNIPSPLQIKNAKLYYSDEAWGLSSITQ